MTPDPNKPYKLTVTRTELEAAAIVAALSAMGIEANATGGHTAGFRAEAPGYVEVWVRQQDLDRAQKALAEMDSDSDPVDWSQVDVGRPE